MTLAFGHTSMKLHPGSPPPSCCPAIPPHPIFRPLPTGKHIFAGALAAGGANTFFKLIEQFRTQDEPAFCGLASVAMVLNSLAIDPRRAWKGPWRWFHEEMLDCCHPLARVREEGVTLDQAACLAHCNGAAVEVYPSGCVSLGTFRDMVRDACASGTEHIIVAYCRADFGQTGDGHHSPVGAYSEAEDLVLILDTARFKYPPHWVPLPMLYRCGRWAGCCRVVLAWGTRHHPQPGSSPGPPTDSQPLPAHSSSCSFSSSPASIHPLHLPSPSPKCTITMHPPPPPLPQVYGPHRQGHRPPPRLHAPGPPPPPRLRALHPGPEG